MRALVKPESGPGMVVRDVPVPPCGPSDVLIKVHYAGVCGTDLHIWEWDAWASARLKPPVVIGHEFAGEIVELGVEARTEGLLAGATGSRPRATSSAATAFRAAPATPTSVAGPGSSASTATGPSPSTSRCRPPT